MVVDPPVVGLAVTFQKIVVCLPPAEMTPPVRLRDAMELTNSLF